MVAVESAGLLKCRCATNCDDVSVQIALNHSADGATVHSDVVNTLTTVDSASSGASCCEGDGVGILVAVDETTGQVEGVNNVSALTTVDLNLS